MKMELVRLHFTRAATEGVLYVNGQRQCYTLEDVVRPRGVKVYGKTAIPAGTYRVVVNESQRFHQRMPLLLNVPDFTGVRIHVGNESKDSDGCILVGADPTRPNDDWIGRSRIAYTRLLDRIEDAIEKGEEVWLTITELAQTRAA